MTVAEVVADVVRRAGVARVFAGGDADPVQLAALAAAHVSVVRVRDPADACVMAAVTGRLGEAPGVALLAHADAGVHRALWAARRDRAPLLVIASGDPGDGDALNSAASGGPDSAAHWAAHAVQAARGEPPGPVWLTIEPGVATRPALPIAAALRAAPPPVDAAAIDRVAAEVAGAARPLIVAGRECRAPGIAPWLRALAEALPAPVLVTAAARGAIPDPHPLAFGLLRAGAAVLARADLILALGVDDEELAGMGAPAAPAVRLGATLPWDPRRATVRADAAGPVAVLVEELAPRLRAGARADWDVAELDRIRRAEVPVPTDRALVTLVARLREATPAGTAAVFSPALRDAAAHWLAVAPGDVLEDERPVAAAAAVALARGDVLVLAFAAPDGPLRVELSAAPGDAVEILTPSRDYVGQAIAAALARRRPTVLIVPLLG